MTRSGWAKIACLVGGIVWGTLWIPIRALDTAGIPGFWSVAALYGTAAILCLPFLLWRPQTRRNGWRQQAAGLTLGTAAAIYGVAFLYTDVAKVVLLYYLSPVWGFLLARLVLGDPVTPVRWLSMALALGGAAIILGDEGWPPLPASGGDWLALAAGVLFVVGSLMMLSWTRIHPLDYTLSFLVWGGLGMLALAWVVEPQSPPGAALGSALPWLLPVVVLILIPGSYAILFGAAVLNPGVVSILYMSEIGVSILLAAILTDEPFGPRQIAGILLIAVAGAAEGLIELAQRRRAQGSSI